MPIDVWVEDLLASRLPEALVRLRGGAPPVFTTVLSKGAKLSEGSAVRATLAILHKVRGEMAAAGRSVSPVSAEEAARRAAVCKGCAEMAAEPACYTCSVKSVLDPWTGFSGTDDAGLGTCHLDGVFLKALVRSSGAACNLRTPGVQFPKSCWRTSDGEETVAPAP